jgi:hypothetical protein
MYAASLKKALAVTEAERQEKVNEIFLQRLTKQQMTPRRLLPKESGNRKHWKGL